MAQAKFISVNVTEYPDKLVEPVMSLLEYIRGLEARLAEIERYKPLWKDPDEPYDGE